MKKTPAKKRRTRLPLLLAGLFFLVWAVAVVFAVGDTFSRPNEINGASNPAFPDGAGGTGVRYPILDRNRRELAVSFPMKSVYARPLEVDDPEVAASFLARELGVDEKRLQRNFHEERGFFWLGRQISEEAGQRIRAAKLKGVYVVDESQRYYPQDSLAAHVVGFVGEGHGLAGIEAKYDRQLRRLTEHLEQEVNGEVHGPLVLTLDLRAQELLEKQLSRLVQATSAAGGCGLLLEAGSGEILALASNPTYDPNFFWEYDEKGRANRVVAVGVEAAGFLNLFRLAASYQQDLSAKEGGGGGAATLTTLKTNLKLARILEKMGEHKDQLVRQGESYLSPALASLDGLEEVDDFPGFSEELGMGKQTLAEVSTVIKSGQSGDSFRPTGLELLADLAVLVNPKGSLPPHLLAGVLEESAGQFHQDSRPAQSVVKETTAERMRAYFRALPRESGGVTILEELTPGTVGEGQEAVTQGDDMPRFSTLLVAMAGGENSRPLLLLLALDQAQVDPTLKTPMSLAAERIMPRARDWAAEAPTTAAWLPRENKWRAEWRSMQVARAGKSQDSAGVDRRQMPDLQGLSLRKALQVLNRYDLKVRVQGTGRVAGQKPGPGAAISGGQCLLVLAGLK
jgi:cell division protein FtsI (penicillin-binding protein 3)